MPGHITDPVGRTRIWRWAGAAVACLLGAIWLSSTLPSARAEAPSLWQVVAARDKPQTKSQRINQARLKAKQKAKAAAAEAAVAKAKIMKRPQILAADPAVLERIGRHIMIGYHVPARVKALVEKKAIAGIFITDHNVQRRSVAQIKAEIDDLQAIRKAQGLPPLIVAADQEGGSVSRLSPPLKRQPALARVLAKLKPGDDRKAAVEAFARTQGQELQRIGVTLNFSPVVDLQIDPKRRSDGQTRLRERAISEDPRVVAEVAGWYCDALAEFGIMCTIKHFPGLGRVKLDTHRTAGDIKVPSLELKGADWVPFQALMHRPHVATMLAHVRLAEVDKDTPASFSKLVVSGLMRGEWKHDGVLVTDDLSMGAVTRSADGLGGAAVKSLNAGADLLLVSFSDRDLDAVMTRLIEAETAGLLDTDMRAQSVSRLSRIPRQAAVSGHAP